MGVRPRVLGAAIRTHSPDCNRARFPRGLHDTACLCFAADGRSGAKPMGIWESIFA